MVYQMVLPSDCLQPYIRDYTLLRCSFNPVQEQPIKPFPANTCESLVFYLRGSLRACNPATGAEQLFPRVAINGVQLSRLNFYISPDYYMIAVNFRAGMLGRFLRSRLAEFVDSRVDGEAVLGPGLRQLFDRMINAPTCVMAISLLEQYLWQRIQSCNMTFLPIDLVTLQMAGQPSGTAIRKWASEACLSLSQFERSFYRQNGVTPRLFARISRFYQAYELKERHPCWDWLRIAVETGYHDYQHLVKDFRQFAGTTPNALLEAQARAPERILPKRLLE